MQIARILPLLTTFALIPPLHAEIHQVSTATYAAVSSVELSGYITVPEVSPDGACVVFAATASNIVAGDTNGVKDVFIYSTASGAVTRVSVASDGTQGNGESDNPTVSSDCRYVAFKSAATNLVSGDSNLEPDIFVRDTSAGTTIRVSVADGGVEANNDSGGPRISGNGRYVVFTSYASNLVAGDTNGNYDVFLFDRQSSTIERVSVGAGAVEANSGSDLGAVSADGRYVTFISAATNLVAGDTNSRYDTFLRDRQLAQTERISVSSSEAEANQQSYSVSEVSDDGRYVLFTSSATNLVGGDTNGTSDIFLRDRTLGTTTLISATPSETIADSGSDYPQLSSDGRYAVFNSSATNLVAGDTNAQADVFRRDLQSGTTVRVSLTTAGTESNGTNTSPAVTQDGRVVFISNGLNMASGLTFSGNYNLYLHVTSPSPQTTRLVTPRASNLNTNDHSYIEGLSSAGDLIIFESRASNLVANDTNGKSDIFLFRRTAGTFERLSMGSEGQEANDASYSAVLTADGIRIAFISIATNLLPGVTNGNDLVYTRLLSESTLQLVTKNAEGTAANGSTNDFAMSADGRYVVFDSSATNLVSGDTNNRSDIFLSDLQTGTVQRINVPAGGGEGTSSSYLPRISADGTCQAFTTSSANLAGATGGNNQAFLRYGGTLSIISAVGGTPANSWVSGIAISPDCSYVAFDSIASNLVAGDTNASSDVFLFNRAAATITRVSKTAGAEGDGASDVDSFTPDGRYLLFSSAATNLVSGDTNGKIDVFSYDLQTGELERLSVGPSGEQGNGDSQNAFATASLGLIGYTSRAVNLAANAASGLRNILVAQYDFCPDDSAKGAAGICGCGVADADSDADGSADCLDGCDSDPAKTAGGVCGCNVADADSDGDGAYDCNEECDNDSSKTAPGNCGCGTADADSDSDGALDCVEECDSDPSKTAAGSCGCGVSDADANGNGVADCLDPGTQYRPAKPSAKVSKTKAGKKSVRFTMEAKTGIQYEVKVGLKGKTKALKTKLRSVNSYSLRLGPGRYWVQYRMKVGSSYTRSSAKTNFLVR